MHRILSYLIFAIFVFASVSCEDDFGREQNSIPDGATTMSFEITYPQFEATQVGRADGSALNVINSVWIVAYTTDGKFYGKYEISKFDEKTGERARFKFTIENGLYRLYAVVNYNLAAVNDTDIDTIDKLKNLQLEWVAGSDETDMTNVAKNAEMFGYFINGTPDNKYPESEGENTIVTVRPGSTQLYAKVRRAASKVTIAFNTTKLRENIFIYLKSVSIVDAPKHCLLGNTNTVTTKDFVKQTIYFNGAKANDKGIEAYQNWPMISRGDSIYGLYTDEKGKAEAGMTVEDRRKREHSIEARAIYFYENCQPQGELGTKSEKSQVVENAEDKSLPTYPEGIDSSTEAWKDARPYGTYIEVKAYYENINTDHPSKGDITYRFMLGKDTKIDYNAERNYHYQITMAFLGNANEIDFHIDYDEENKPGVYAPDVMIPYYYNQESSSTLRATPKPGYEMTSVEAYIINNEWRPTQYVGENGISGIYNETSWNMQQNYENSYTKLNVVSGTYKKDHEECAPNCEFGYLSLYRVTESTVITNGGAYQTDLSTKNIRDRYYNAELSDKTTHVSLGKRIFKDGIPTENGSITTTDVVSGDYTITRSAYTTTGAFEYICKFPVFTRAKTIGTWEVYSGANPYHTNSRLARILYVVNYRKIDDHSDTYTDKAYCNLYQTRRIDNPRAIYRRHDNLTPFQVTLMRQDGTDQLSSGFSPVTSRGTWSATIEKDPHGIVRLSANGQVATGEGNSIKGQTNSEITFTYTPNKAAPENASYGAIILVRYHNETCTHYILVRQGYGPTELKEGGPKWSTFNVYDYQHLTKNPLSIGALFRRYTYMTYPILEYTDGNFGYGQNPGSAAKFKLGAPNKDNPKTWDDILAYGEDDGKVDAFTGIEIYNSAETKLEPYRLPEVNDLPGIGISTSGTDIDSDVNYGFGIAYGDGATRTLATADAYGFTDPENMGADSEKGTRCVVAYNVKTGNNLIFPFGVTGHGRRKSTKLEPGYDPASTVVYGLMRYGSIDAKLDKRDFDFYRPLAWDLPSQQGAPYWINNENGKQSAISAGGSPAYPIAIDFNSGNYMVAFLNSNDLNQNKKYDACPVKPIVK